MNIKNETIEKIKQLGYHVETEVSLFENELGDGLELDKAQELYVSKWESDGSFNSKCIKCPKKKEVTVDWIMNKIFGDSIYVNLSKYMEKITSSCRMSVYPTSYGIGVDSLFYENSESRKFVEKKLNELGIKYRTEYSSAHWVFRYVISKDESNMKIIKGL